MAIMARTTLDRFGRVLIPLEVRRALGFKPGDELEITVARDAASFTLAEPRPNFHYRDRVLVFSGEAEGDEDFV